jgi:hypothetical protein
MALSVFLNQCNAKEKRNRCCCEHKEMMYIVPWELLGHEGL